MTQLCEHGVCLLTTAYLWNYDYSYSAVNEFLIVVPILTQSQGMALFHSLYRVYGIQHSCAVVHL